MNISSLLFSVGHGRLELPSFTRDFVWKRSKIIRLFASLYRGYPVGSLIFWTPSTAATPQQPEAIKRSQPAEFIVDGQQRITAIYCAARDRPANFRPGMTWSLPPLHFHVDDQAFAFYAPRMKDDPRWINLPDFFGHDEPRVGEFVGRIYETPAGPTHIGEYARRLNQLGGILSRNLAVEYLPSDASREDAVEIYLAANGGGFRK